MKIFFKVVLLQVILSSMCVHSARIEPQPQGRQGILEIPKQIATIIRNTIDESIERVFPTSTKKVEEPVLDPVTPPPRSKTTSETPISTRIPGDTALGQYIVDNFIITSSTAQPLKGLHKQPDPSFMVPIAPGSDPLALNPIQLSSIEVDELLNIIGPTTTTKRPLVLVTEETEVVTQDVAVEESTVDTEEPTDVNETTVGVDEDPEDATIAATTSEPEEEISTTVGDEDVDEGDEVTNLHP